jgi:flagellin
MSLKIGPHTTRSGVERAHEALQKAMAQLSSGSRITRAGDDAAGLAISEQLSAAERTYAQGQRNLSDGISVTRTAEGALGSVSEIATRMRELAVQAGNGALGDDAVATIQKEYDSLAQEVTRISGATEFSGRNLLNGDTSGGGSITLRDGSGGSGLVQVSIADHSAGALGVEGRNVSESSTLDAIDRALTTISTTRADLGAAERRLETGIRNLQTIRENTLAARSRVRDADFAEAASEHARGQILERASIATQAQANISAKTVLDLLR